MKKGLILGAIFGALIVPISTLGLAVTAIEIFVRPLTLIPRTLVNTMIDTATTNGFISIGLLMIVSAVFYALIAMILARIRSNVSRGLAITLAILLYLGLLFADNPAFLQVGA